MKLALFGYGAMGQLVEQLATAAGDEIGVKLTSQDSDQGVDEIAAMLRRHDVAIDFSIGSIVLKNVEACALAGVPLVEGTTGWLNHEEDVRRIVKEHDGALVYGANFSIGVNIFYKITAHASQLMDSSNAWCALRPTFPTYRVGDDRFCLDQARFSRHTLTANTSASASSGKQ